MASDPATRIEGEEQYRGAVRELERRARPSWVLRTLMNGLEAYRQARKLGWSRPQNKQGLTTFQAYKLSPAECHTELTWCVRGVLSEFEQAAAHGPFLQDLQDEAEPMGFVFVHDLRQGGRRFEGATFSFGRRVEGAPRHRDRFDVIVESEVVGGRSVGFSRLRAYVDPFRRPVHAFPSAVYTRDRPRSTAATEIFERAVRLHERWRHQASHHWSHWTQEYIDYFGPRTSPVQGTFFPGQADDLDRLKVAS